MSVWKKLNNQDSFVTSYVAKKRWSLTGSDLESAGVKLLPAYSDFNIPTIITPDADCTINLEGILDPILGTCEMLLNGENTCLINLSGEVV